MNRVFEGQLLVGHTSEELFALGVGDASYFENANPVILPVKAGSQVSCVGSLLATER